GIRVQGAGAGSNVFQGNFIGTDISGGAAITTLGNGGSGIEIVDAPANTVGGTGPGQANIIAVNGASGIAVVGAGAVGNTIRGNSIDANGGLGIDLGADGVTPNDSDDSDTGPNNLQNFPNIEAVLVSSTTSVSGTLKSLPNAIYTLDFYSS